jgi:hypothetical protein
MNPIEVFQILEHAHTQIKFWHQQTESYAEHMALNGFYEGISPLADSIRESVIEVCEKVNIDFGMRFKAYQPGCVKKYLEYFKKKITELQSQTDETDIINTLDEVKALTNKTLYLLGRK